MIKRLDANEHVNVEDDVINQHGVFVIDNKEICTVRIISMNSAIVMLDNYVYLDELIDEFRYYAEHITIFYDDKKHIIKEFPAVQLKEIDLLKIQPSQFYINESKIDAISTFVNSKEDVIIPVYKLHSVYVAVDGHTRLYVANQKGLQKVYIFETSEQEELGDFVIEAQRRNINKITDCEVLNDEAYKKEWYTYCNQYFSDKTG